MSVLDTQKVKPLFSVRESMRNAARDYGKSIPSQLIEMAILGVATGKLTPKDYFFYALYDDRKYSLSEKKRFVGHSAQMAMNYICNDEEWREVAKNKIAFAQFFQERGFPVARITRRISHAEDARGNYHAAQPRRTERLFSERASYPLFSKPARGMDSLGAARLEAFDEASTSSYWAMVGESRSINSLKKPCSSRTATFSKRCSIRTQTLRPFVETGSQTCGWLWS